MDELKAYKKAGIYPKYYVTKTADGSEVRNCFVLRPEHDPAAVTAMRAYAEATDNKSLAEDIYSWVGRAGPENKCANCGIDLGPVYCPKCYKALHEDEKNPPLTLEELSKRDDPVWAPLDDGTGYWCLCHHGYIMPPSCLPFMAEDRPQWTFLDHKPEQEGRK